MWAIVTVLAAIVALTLWLHWIQGWKQLESGLRASNALQEQKPVAQVPADVMQRLLIHRVEPVYPSEARRRHVEGTIALEIVVGKDGSVASMHAMNGPDVLARAAMDALRWWKFEPYRLNGEAVPVQTTVAVEFKR